MTSDVRRDWSGRFDRDTGAAIKMPNGQTVRLSSPVHLPMFAGVYEHPYDGLLIYPSRRYVEVFTVKEWAERTGKRPWAVYVQALAYLSRKGRGLRYETQWRHLVGEPDAASSR